MTILQIVAIYFTGATINVCIPFAREAYMSAYERRKAQFGENCFGWAVSSIIWPITLPASLTCIAFKRLGARHLLRDERLAADKERTRKLLREQGIEP
jgi:hypothetical protein